MLIRSEMIGFGHYLPNKVLTNDDLSKMVETNDEWIRTRTGIVSRHIVEDETTSVIAGNAVANAIDRFSQSASFSGNFIMAVIVSPCTSGSRLINGLPLDVGEPSGSL